MPNTAVTIALIQSATSLGTNATTETLNIGTGAEARTINIGADESTKVDVNAIAIELDSVGAMNLSSGGALDIDTAGTAAINLGTEAAAKTITIGNAASTAVNVNALVTTITSVNALSVTDGAANLAFNGSGATTLTTVAYDHNASGAITIDASGSNAINIGATSATGQVNLGTAGARTITMGNTTALTKVVLNSASYDVSNPANGGITTIGNIHLDTGVENRRPGSPPPRPSATIVTFTNNDGTDLSSSAGLVVKASGEMGCELAVTANDNIIGILSKGDEDGESVQVQIGGIMLAKFTGANTAGNLASIHGSNGTLVDMSQSTLTDAADARFITVRSGDSGTNNSLVMWLKGESF